MWRNQLLNGATWAPEGGESGSTTEPTGSTAAPTAGGGAGDPPPWAKDLNTAVGGLTGTIKELLTLAARREQQSPPQPAQSAQSADDDDDEPTAEELETLSRADFGKHIVSAVLKAVNKQVVEPINQQIQSITQHTTRNEIQGSVKELAAQNKDFWEWQPEMLALANENRGMAPKRLYQLARADNPTKAKELDTKYGEKKPTGEGSGRVRFKGFGGLTPSQSGSGGKARNMGGSEAAKTAWAETVAALGGEPDFSEE